MVSVESSRASPPHRSREDGLAHPADTSRTNLASAVRSNDLIAGVAATRSHDSCNAVDEWAPMICLHVYTLVG
jgi:hypothetical protein